MLDVVGSAVELPAFANYSNLLWLLLLCSHHKLDMAFAFRWPRFSDQFHADAIQMLNSALNKGNKPPVIADRIEVIELEMGSQVSVCTSQPHSMLISI